MPVIDIVHRAILIGLVGVGTGGVLMGFQVHRDILRRGFDTGVLISAELAREIEVQKEVALSEGKEIENEKALAEAAQSILKSRGP
ncbi:hypothetical protein EW145_g3088 [Phellinidium pouzarii]|uniref:Uncharacterized protein n=1 Tax=Phellinidium pouzarii TaxID=167371 RepID=A0A4S4L8C1_9AGAM|nr:hypothetical protein EW145_g3088 [Phellinidium pouzarii]